MTSNVLESSDDEAHIEDVDWIFEKLGPHGARDAGDPAQHAFSQDTETFVREVLQNSVDQVLDDHLDVIFRLRMLNGDELKSFKQAIRWPNLESHLSAVTETGTESGVAIHQFLNEFENELLVVCIEDRYTTGLEGPEQGGTSNFTALCKDRLYSHKSDSTAGGSYGLGKSVLWAFSGISTVLFNSTLNEVPDNHDNPRFIGRSIFPSHTIGNRGYRGPGWFGKVTEANDEQKAESLWGKEAGDRAGSLFLSRGEQPGTSILIPGFRDPTSDTDREAGDFASAFDRAAVKYFWPAMVDDNSLTVTIDDRTTVEQIDVTSNSTYQPFIECYTNQDSPLSTLSEGGDIVSKDIPFEIPNRVDGTTTPKGTVSLVVRMANEDDNPSMINNIARFRGTGMVVNYQRKRRLPLGSRDFFACLVCGTAKTDPTVADRAIDEFLRAAEPPSHKEWTSTQALKQRYQRGYSSVLERLEQDVNEVLRGIITPTPERGERGPDKLRKRFPIGHRTGGPPPGRGKLPLSIQSMQANYIDGRWEFGAQVTLKEPNEVAAWNASVVLWAVGEDGSRIDELSIDDVTVNREEISVALLPKEVTFHSPSSIIEFEFTGKTKSDVTESDSQLGRVELEVQGEVTDEPAKKEGYT